MEKYLKIISIASEVDPFSKTGGLADVARSLPKALHRLGHNVAVITPLHGTIQRKKFNLKLIKKEVPIKVDKNTTIKVNFYESRLMFGLPIYFIDNQQYFGKYKTIYNTKINNQRFFLFCLAALELIKRLDIQPEIIHCHDWQTGLIPHLLKERYKKDRYLGRATTVYTIHNLVYQMGTNWWEIRQNQRDDGRSRLPAFKNKKKMETINFAKRALINADIINTVSESYANEILTKSFGEDLHRILQNRKDRLFGIINGIDYFDFNPSTDSGLFKNYSLDTLEKKMQNKISLQKEFNLPVNTGVPLIGMVSRITEQKGFDLLIAILDVLMQMNLQIVIMGGGEKKYEKFFAKMAKKYPKKLALHSFSTKKATQVYAGSDIFLMPSRFEPCGLGQLISLRYGSVPIVRATGGLIDTITDFKPQIEKGNGFTFRHYDSKELLIAITRALETFKYKKVWQNLVKKGMQQSSSWEIPARKYVKLYRKAIYNKQQNGK